MLKRIYLDTSVYGGYFDFEFEVWTKMLFSQIANNEFLVLYSYLIELEISFAPEQVQLLANSIPLKNKELINYSDKAIELATVYINEKVVGLTSISDCIHIALATIHNADVLVSWNFKHIVNVERIRGYNSVNLSRGYKALEIRTPNEILNYE
jgi:predicted nucleic acid-binding protein